MPFLSNMKRSSLLLIWIFSLLLLIVYGLSLNVPAI